LDISSVVFVPYWTLIKEEYERRHGFVLFENDRVGWRDDRQTDIWTRQDKTRQDKTRQDKTRQDKTRQDKTDCFHGQVCTQK
jgi:hypothetical protein